MVGPRADKGVVEGKRQSPTKLARSTRDGSNRRGGVNCLIEPLETRRLFSAATGPVALSLLSPAMVASSSSSDLASSSGATARAAVASPRGANSPTVTAISPTHGPLNGGTLVTITGTNFTGATTVGFGSVATTGFTVVSDTEITATTPMEDVSVTTPNGSSAASSADQFTYTAFVSGAPTVTGVAPAMGPTTGGTSVTITGTNFTGATTVDFGSVPAPSIVIASDTQIVATTPAEAAGRVDVTVTNTGGTSATSPADRFTFGGSNHRRHFRHHHRHQPYRSDGGRLRVGCCDERHCRFPHGNYCDHSG
jgi:hypothetical protein